MPKKSANDGLKPWEVAVSAQRFIRTPTPTIIKAMLETLETEQDKCAVIDFSERLASLYTLRSVPHRESLRRSFDIFCPDPDSLADPEALKLAFKAYEAHADQADADGLRFIEREEDIFLQLLHTAFSKANFQLLSQSEYDAGKEEYFEVAVELEMESGKLDSTFIERLFDRMDHYDEFKNAAAVNRQVLVYHRGQGQATISGMFILEKIDIIISKLFALLFSMFFIVLDLIRGFIDIPGHIRRIVRLVRYVSTTMLTKSAGSDMAEASTDDKPKSTELKNMARTMRTVLRNTLRHTLRNNWLALLTSVTLLEPTFREMIIVYRTVDEMKHAETEGRVPHVEIKTFANVPMSDFEIVLPKQRTVTRPSDIVKLLAIIGLASWYVYTSVTEELENNPNAGFEDLFEDMFPVLLGAGTYASKAITQWMNAQKIYNEAVTKYLYQKSYANNFTVFSYLMDAIIHQEQKEALLAYFFLWQHGAQMAGVVDSEVESFLALLNEDVDFDARDAIEKLRSDHLVFYEGSLQTTTHLKYLPISKCIRLTEEHVKETLRSRDRPCPYCTVFNEIH
mmetsp:Transcript_2107/g.6534  ORF Transcript_2107/g.6534 Transcript_2107/m.6534 type:complete len:566 (+) Transcript_2107:119-1816(+)